MNLFMRMCWILIVINNHILSESMIFEEYFSYQSKRILSDKIWLFMTIKIQRIHFANSCLNDIWISNRHYPSVNICFIGISNAIFTKYVNMDK
jgi:hypothetical protein